MISAFLFPAIPLSFPKNRRTVLMMLQLNIFTFKYKKLNQYSVQNTFIFEYFFINNNIYLYRMHAETITLIH